MESKAESDSSRPPKTTHFLRQTATIWVVLIFILIFWPNSVSETKFQINIGVVIKNWMYQNKIDKIICFVGQEF